MKLIRDKSRKSYKKILHRPWKIIQKKLLLWHTLHYVGTLKMQKRKKNTILFWYLWFFSFEIFFHVNIKTQDDLNTKSAKIKNYSIFQQRQQKHALWWQEFNSCRRLVHYSFCLIVTAVMMVHHSVWLFALCRICNSAERILFVF